ncbi:MAG: ribonuclease E/G [Clostridia bacterium]|nr:ribonuclease E/G [Clostridia bacterium]
MDDDAILLYIRDGRTEAVLIQAGRPVEWSVQGDFALNDVFLGICGAYHEGLAGTFVRIGPDCNALLPAAGAPAGLAPGRRLPVQIRRLRDEAAKGPVADARIRLPGRYAVDMPDGRSIRRSVLASMEPEEAERCFRREEKNLQLERRRILTEAESGPAPRCLRRFGDPVSIALREWGREAPIHVEGLELYREVSERAQDPDIRRRLCLAVPDPRGGLWTEYGLEQAWRERAAESVALRCGGNIRIERTHALVAVDVNSGRAEADGPERLARRVNIEAAVEAARQMRLRNLSGILFVDFLRTDEAGREEILSLLKAETSRDKGKVRIEGFTRLGLLEMTRNGV